jgi:predicted transcriptional regulator
MADKQERGRYRNGMLRISNEAIAAVREMRKRGESQTVIGQKLGISQPHVSRIIRGVSRRDE